MPRLVEGFVAPSSMVEQLYKPGPRVGQLTSPATQNIAWESIPWGSMTPQSAPHHPRPRVVLEPSKAHQGPHSQHFALIAYWIGAVMDIGTEEFTASLEDPRGKLMPHEGEFPIGIVSESDMPLLDVGAIFYWSVGYVWSKSGRKSLQSLVRLRRSRPPLEEALERQREWVQEMKNVLEEASVDLD